MVRNSKSLIRLRPSDTAELRSSEGSICCLPDSSNQLKTGSGRKDDVLRVPSVSSNSCASSFFGPSSFLARLASSNVDVPQKQRPWTHVALDVVPRRELLTKWSSGSLVTIVTSGFRPLRLVAEVWVSAGTSRALWWTSLSDQLLQACGICCSMGSLLQVLAAGKCREVAVKHQGSRTSWPGTFFREAPAFVCPLAGRCQPFELKESRIGTLP